MGGGGGGLRSSRGATLHNPQGFGRNWGGNEERRHTHTDTHTRSISWSGVGWALFWRNRSSHDSQHVWYRELNREAGLLNTFGERVWDYRIQINKEAGFMVYSGIKEASLVHLSRSTLLREAVLRLETSGIGERKLW